MANAAELIIKLSGKDQVSGMLSGVSGKAGKLGGVLGKALKVGAVAGGAALLGAGVASLKMGMDFEKSMAEVKTLMPDISEKAFGKLRDDVLDFSKEMGIATDKAVPALYQAISAGVPKENVMEFMTVASKAAIGGVTELETAVDGITSVINAYGVENISAAKAADVMFTGVRLGKTTFNELSASLFNVVPIAAASGVSFEEITAALAALTAQGVPTTVATTQLRAAIQALTAPTVRQSKMVKELGLDFSVTALQQKGLSGAMKEAIEATGGNMEQLRKLFGSVEAVQAVLALGGEQAYKFDEALAQMGQTTGAVDAAFETMEETTSRKLTKAINEIKVEMTKLGVTVLPILVEALEKGSEALKEWWAEHGPKVKDTLGDLKDLVDDVRNAVGPFAEDFVSATGEILTHLKDLANYIYENKPLMIAAILAIGVAIVVAFGPYSAAVAAIIGLITAIGALAEAWDTLPLSMRLAIGAMMGVPGIAMVIKNEFEGMNAEIRKSEDPLKEVGIRFESAEMKAARLTPAIEDLDSEVARMRRTFLDTKKPIVDFNAGLGGGDGADGGAGGAAGGAAEAFRGLSDELAGLRQQMRDTADLGLGLLNQRIQEEEAFLAALEPVLEDAVAGHEKLEGALAEVKVQIDEATSAIQDWEQAVLKGTRAFSDAAQALTGEMDTLNLAIAKIELGMIEEGLEEGGYASDYLSRKVRELARAIGLDLGSSIHMGKMKLEDIQEVLAAAGVELDTLSQKASVVDLEEKVKLGPKQYALEKFFQDLGGYAEYSFDEIIAGASKAAKELALLTVQQNDLKLSLEQQAGLVAFYEEVQRNHAALLEQLQEQYANLGQLAEDIDPAIKAIWEAESGAVISSIEDAFAAIDAGQTGAAATAMANAMALFAEIKQAVAEVYPGAETVLAPLEALLKDVETSVEIDVADVGRLLSGDLSAISNELGTVNKSVGDVEKTTANKLQDVLHSLEANVVFLLGSIRSAVWNLFEIKWDVAWLAQTVANLEFATASAQSGGTIRRGGLISVHAGETIIPAPPAVAASSEVHLHIDGPFLGDRYAAEQFAQWLEPYFVRRGEVR